MVRDFLKGRISYLLLIPALGLAVIYYALAAARQDWFRFLGGLLTLNQAEADFMVFYTAVSLYFTGFFLFFLIFRKGTGNVRSLLGKVFRHRLFIPAVLVISFAAMVAARFWLFKRTPLTDDENVYLFVARTLLEGRLKNPAPEFYELFKNQFIIVDQNQWLGQYTIGHPLILALGLLTGLTDFIVPLVSTVTLLLVYLIARDHFDEKAARASLILLALSPQFILTSGTLLGYPTAAFASALLVFAGWRLFISRWWPYLILFGIASMLLLLNRQHSWISLGLPLAVYFILLAVQDRDLKHLYIIAAMGLMAVLSLGLFLWINKMQTGSPFKTAQYLFMETWGKGTGMGFGQESPFWGVHTFLKGLANVLVSLARQNLWLFGWPLSLMFLFFIRVRGFALFLLAWVVAFYALKLPYYSTGICLTGPVHYFETIVPLTLLSAHGLVRLDGLCADRMDRPYGLRLVPALLISSYLGFILMFMPPVLGSLNILTERSSLVYGILDRNQVHNAVIFIDQIVEGYEDTWAYFPPDSGPDLEKADRIYVRWPGDERRIDEFMGQFPTRQVWGVVFTGKDRPILLRRFSGKFEPVSSGETYDTAEAHFSLGNVLIRHGKIDEAVREMERALVLDPDNTAVSSRLGFLYIKTGELDKAAAQYRKILSGRPEVPESLSNLAVIRLMTGENDQAASLFKAIRELNPNDPNLYYGLACAYAKQNKVDESVDWLRQAVERGFEDWDLLRTDPDLENIRHTPYYEELIRNR